MRSLVIILFFALAVAQKPHFNYFPRRYKDLSQSSLSKSTSSESYEYEGYTKSLKKPKELASRWSEIKRNPNFLALLREGRIVGGTEAARNQFPFQIMFFNELIGGNSSICGGSIISANYVLGAAHCFIVLESSDIVAGVHDYTQDDPVHELTVFPRDITNHPQYNGTTYANDISIVWTGRSPFVFNTTAVQPINFAPRTYINANLVGLSVRVAGWGITRDNGTTSPVLMFIDTPVISNVDCRRRFGDKIIDSMFCLSGVIRSTCSGDSGGGATILHGTSRVLLGVVSLGAEEGCQRDRPTVMTRATSFYNWITLATGIVIV